MTGHVERRRSRWRLRADRQGEDGAIVVVFAAALVMIMVCVGFAVDLGNFTQRHQQTQDAADAAALSGAQQLGQLGQLGAAALTTALGALAASVENYVDKNDGYAPPLGSNVWDTCPTSSIPTSTIPPSTIPTPFATPPTPNGSPQDCVSFGQIRSDTTNVIHVVIPPEIVDYTFGRAAGLTNVHISSAATAAVESPGLNTILPVAISTLAGNGGYWCIKGGNGGSDCPNKVSPGDEGLLISPRYRTFINTPNSGTGNNDTGKVDLAIGIDHELNVYVGPPSAAYCDANSSPALSACKKSGGSPNNSPPLFDLASEVFLLSGNTAITAIDGLLAGFYTDPFTFSPRLAHPNWYQPTGTNSATSEPAGPTLGTGDAGYEGTPLNGRQVSYYMLYDWGSTGPTSLANSTDSTCFPNTNPVKQNVDSPVWTNTDDTCLAGVLSAATAAANAGTYTGGPIFSSSIIGSPRFGFVPVVVNGSGGESSMWQIVGFEAVYLDVIDVVSTKSHSKDLSAWAWVFSPQLIQSDPAPPGAALASYLGGPYVTNLCSLAAGNC